MTSLTTIDVDEKQGENKAFCTREISNNIVYLAN